MCQWIGESTPRVVRDGRASSGEKDMWPKSRINSWRIWVDFVFYASATDRCTEVPCSNLVDQLPGGRGVHSRLPPHWPAEQGPRSPRFRDLPASEENYSRSVTVLEFYVFVQRRNDKFSKLRKTHRFILFFDRVLQLHII